MAKKTFIEQELERERKLRGESPIKKTNRTIDRNRFIAAEKSANLLGLILTPNEIRAEYEYPTISDEPQTVVVVQRYLN